jgi:tetratricopeptide (TPR) repeat protein
MPLIQEKLNVKLLAYLVGIVALVSSGWYFLHEFQVRRTAHLLLDQATRAEEQGHSDRALRSLGRYLVLSPRDSQARLRYGLMLEKTVRSIQEQRKLSAVFEEVLLREPEHNDIRRRLASAYVDSSQFDAALVHLKVLEKLFPEDGELKYLIGRCHEGHSDYADAVQAYQAAIGLTPGRIDAYPRLALLLRERLAKPGEADQCMKTLIDNNKKAFQAYLQRAAYWKKLRLAQPPFSEQGNLLDRAAAADISEALRLAPDEADVVLAAAESAQAQQRWDLAREHLRRGLEHHPEDVRMYQVAAELEFHAGRIKEARECLSRGLKRWPGREDLLWSQAALLIEAGKLAEARAAVDQLHRTQLPRPRVDYLEATLAVKQEQWREGRELLEGVRPQLLDFPELLNQIDLLLAQCYENLGDHDAALAACRRTLATDSLSLPTRLGVVRALTHLGRHDEALGEYQQIMQLPHPPAAGWVVLAGLMIDRTLHKPAAERRWTEIEQVLTRAGSANPGAVEVAILLAEVALQQKKFNEGRAILETAQGRHADQSAVWIARAELAQRTGQSKQAREILDAAVARLGARVDLRLARARVLLRTGNPAEQVLAEVTRGLEKFAGPDHVQLLNGLAEDCYQSGNTREASRLWTQVAELQPSDLAIRLRLFDLARQEGDEPMMQRLIKDIQSVEGQDQPLGLCCEALRLLWRAAQTQADPALPARQELLKQSRDVLAVVAARRPAWAQTHLCLAELAELDGQPEQALEEYLRATDLGSRQPWVIRRAVELLYERRKYVEAEQLLLQLPAEAPVLIELRRLAAELSLQTRDYPRALELAKKAVSDDSQDYRDHLWLGWMLSASGNRAEAEPAFRRAVRLAPKVPDTWVALVQYLARLGQKDKARAAIEEALRHIPRQHADLPLAQCYEAVGDLNRARELQEAALRAQPEHVPTLEQVAKFYLRTNQPAKAYPLLERLADSKIQSPVEAQWARRTLSVVRAANGDYRQSLRAISLLGIPDRADLETGPAAEPAAARPQVTTAEEPLEELRAKARVLSVQPDRPHRLQAIRYWEACERGQSLKGADQFVLAQLYEATGNWPKARERMPALLTEEDQIPQYLASYAASLLRHGDTVEAAVWIGKLESLPEQATEFQTVALKARLWAAKQKNAEAVALLKAYVDDSASRPADPAGRYLPAAALLENLSDNYAADRHYAEAAEEMYRRYAAKVQQPESILVLAAFLGHQGRVAEALDICTRAANRCAPEAVGETYLEVLQSSLVRERDYQAVSVWLEEALEKNRNSLILVLCLAQLRDLQGRYPESQALYRKALEQDGKSVVALNNLAWSLALASGKGQEALALIERAIDIFGPTPELVDTRAVVYLTLGKATRSAADLEDATADPSLGLRLRASLYFHLAQAYQQIGKLDLAAALFRKAQAAGLRSNFLHPLERPGYEKMLGLPHAERTLPDHRRLAA